MKTLKQISKETGISRSTLRDRIRRKKIVGQKVGNTWVLGPQEETELLQVIPSGRSGKAPEGDKPCSVIGCDGTATGKAQYCDSCKPKIKRKNALRYYHKNKRNREK